MHVNCQEDYCEQAANALRTKIAEWHAFAKVIHGLSSAHLADLLNALTKPSNPYSSKERELIIAEACKRLSGEVKG